MRVFLQYSARRPQNFERDLDVLVPLDAYAAISGTRDACQVDDVRRRITHETVRILPERVEESLSALGESLGAERASLVYYEASVLATVLEYWRLVYRSLAEEYPGARFTTDLGGETRQEAATLMQACDSIRLRALHDELEVLTLAEADLEPLSISTHRSLRSRLLAAADHVLGLLRLIETVGKYRVRRLYRRLPRASPHAGGALVIAHTNKRALLLAQLRDVIPYEEIAISELIPKSQNRIDDSTIHAAQNLGGTSGWKTMEDYLRHRLEGLDAMNEKVAALAAGTWAYLLTDQENDPYIRYLLSHLSGSDSKCVIATPEGAQSLVGREMFSSAVNFFFVDQPIVRCATSLGEAQRMSTLLPCSSVVASGYLAVTPASRGLGAGARRALVRPLLKRSRNTVLLNLDNEPDIGVFRIGMPSMHEKLASYLHLLRALSGSGWGVIVTCKSQTGIGAIREASGELAEAILVDVPWTDLLKWADVVIQRDSSLGPEAVAAGYPTIIWDDLGLPLASREWLEGNQPWVQYCTDESSLLVALGRVRRGIAPKQHPQLWDLITPERQVADWIVTDRARRREVRTGEEPA